MSTTLDCKDKEIRKSGFVTKTQFLSAVNYRLLRLFKDYKT